MMQNGGYRFNWSKALCRAVASVVLAAGLTFTVASLQAQEQVAEVAGPFAALAGNWSGTGIIRTKEGAQERIRCRGSYDVGEGARNLRQVLRCASDSYNFDLNTDMTQIGGQLAGNWIENTRHVAGKISGQATPTTIRARADGDTFTALLSVNTHGDRQSVSILSPGAEISEVSIALTRGR